jgi:hypothetical protein
MLDIETKLANFSNFKNLLLFMQEEHLLEIDIIKITYVFQTTGFKGIYTLDEVTKITEGYYLD